MVEVGAIGSHRVFGGVVLYGEGREELVEAVESERGLTLA